MSAWAGVMDRASWPGAMTPAPLRVVRAPGREKSRALSPVPTPPTRLPRECLGWRWIFFALETSEDGMSEVVAINRRLRAALFATGEVVAFSTLIDGDGEETDDFDDARAGVVQAPDGGWCAVKFGEFESAAVN